MWEEVILIDQNSRTIVSSLIRLTPMVDYIELETLDIEQKMGCLFLVEEKIVR
ncbi:hypothetical protein D3C81_1217320 [compost metagenome]